jgi:hypothetical protein
LAKECKSKVTALTLAEPYHVASMDAVLVSVGEDEYEEESRRISDQARRHGPAARQRNGQGAHPFDHSGDLLGKPDLTRTLAGSEVGFGIPGVGVFVGGNVTPDKETGLGDWTTEQIIAAITKGAMPDGRKLFPVMPWPELAHLSADDAQAIAAYLKSLPPVKNAVPGPFGPKDVPSTLVSVIVPGGVYAKMPAPK